MMAVAPSPAVPGPVGRISRLVTAGALAYWGLFALLAPVINIDAQMYNLTRLELALRGGFFNNDHFTSVFHVIFPWSFDAVHLPFLLLGWGYALPSFLCLAGTGLVAFTMIRMRFGPDAAWLGVASLLALPCLVYQGASNKNDIAILFSGAVWVYARWRWHREGGGIHLLWMVLAVGFMIGAKTSGVFYGGILALVTLWEIRRREPKLIAQVAAGLLAAVLLLGSVETYAEAARLYGHPLGPPPLIKRMSNRDGLPGALANLARYAAGGLYLGPTDFSDGQPMPKRLAAATRALLDRAGLTDAGIDPRFADRRLFLHQSGLEELSGFGPVGTLALGIVLLAGLRWRPREAWWRLAAAALLGFAVLSLTVGYTPWNNRYQICWYALGTLALVCALWEKDFSGRATVRSIYLLVVIAAVIGGPLLSFNRHPAALLAAVQDRERLETSAFPVVGEVRSCLRRLHRESPDARIFLVVHNESVVLPLLEDEALRVIMVREPVFDRLAETGRLVPGDLIARENPAGLPGLVLVAEVTAPNVYSHHGTTTHYVYRVVAPAR